MNQITVSTDSFYSKCLIKIPGPNVESSTRSQTHHPPCLGSDIIAQLPLHWAIRLTAASWCGWHCHDNKGGAVEMSNNHGFRDRAGLEVSDYRDFVCFSQLFFRFVGQNLWVHFQSLLIQVAVWFRYKESYSLSKGTIAKCMTKNFS